MSEALTRILNDARDFSDKIKECRSATSFIAADYRDAYGRLGRLRERYRKERDARTLDPVEAQALHRVFEDDVFIKGVLDGRQISEHIQKRSGGGPVVPLMTNRSVPLSAETTVGSFFAAAVVLVPDPQGKIYYVNHLEQLEEAERRIQRALDRATKKQP